MYRIKNNRAEFFLVHPGGPYWTNKDIWGIPKGLVEDKENDLLKTAIREFKEETGIEPKEPYINLGTIEQKNGKTVHAWAFKGDCKDVSQIKSNFCEIEWPPNSGKIQKIPEIDKAEFFSSSIAKQKINPAQKEFINRLENDLSKTGN